MSQDNSQNDDSNIKVTDRRSFSSEGEKREPDAPSEAVQQPASETSESNAAEQSDAGSLPSIDFSSFVLSLSTSAMMHLGLIENPITKQREEDLDMANHEIQIIEMLRDKTKGNLSDEESQIIESALYRLRLSYVEKRQS